MSFGVDYSAGFPGAAPLAAAGVTFVARYLSPAGNSKNLTSSEVRACLSAGIAVAAVWETTAQRMLSGYAGGAADARSADAMASGLGLSGIPLYFACDWDCTSADQTAISAYLDGVASVIGCSRTGIYGGYWPVKRALDAGKAAFAWQTYAWSGNPTLWDSRAQLQQYKNGVTIAGIDTDLDRSMAEDFGQWPRPGGPATYPVLILGDSGAYVTLAQQRLNVWGASPQLTVDGQFGAATDAAVRAFQTAQGLIVDGVVGPETWKALNAAPVVPGQILPPSWLAVDKTRLALTWGPVDDPALTGYTACAYGLDGKMYATAVSECSWCILDHLVPGWTYNIRIWCNGGSVAPLAVQMTVTMPV